MTISIHTVKITIWLISKYPLFIKISEGQDQYVFTQPKGCCCQKTQSKAHVTQDIFAHNIAIKRYCDIW